MKRIGNRQSGQRRTGPGQSFSELPGDRHGVGANASETSLPRGVRGGHERDGSDDPIRELTVVIMISGRGSPWRCSTSAHARGRFRTAGWRRAENRSVDEGGFGMRVAGRSSRPGRIRRNGGSSDPSAMKGPNPLIWLIDQPRSHPVKS